MPLQKLSDEYYERNYFLKTNTVPLQSVMKKRMSPALAKVYFNSMTPKLKELAGLAPPLKGGGSGWYVPPDELQKGRTVLKPVKKQHISKLGFEGITHFSEKIVADHNRHLEELKEQKLREHDEYHKKFIDGKCAEEMKECGYREAKNNIQKIDRAFQQFSFMYRSSLNKLEDLLTTAAMKDFMRVKAETLQHMQTRYEKMIKQQAAALYDAYDERLLKKKETMETEFIKNFHETRKLISNQIHDINVEKHVAIKKLRHLIECQNMACQVYVALKEREECAKEKAESKHKHRKEVKHLTEEIASKDLEIKLAKGKEKKRREFQSIWNKKVCEVVQKFQLFVSYSLHELPEYADFFINTEKLLLLQLNEVLENPEVETIFECDRTESFHIPVPQPHPYFLFCDKSYKPNIDQNLCPKHCTSSASQLPVIVVNKKCIYAACDNFEMFTDKVTQYVHGKRDDAVFVDHHYTDSIPAKYTLSAQIHNLKLESSLLRLLQNEWVNVRNLPIQCCSCRVPYCFCSRLEAEPISDPIPSIVSSQTLDSLSSGNKITLRSIELEHEREPKWGSFMEYVKSKKCKCPKIAKKHLEENLPSYMRQMSEYEAPDLPHYEMCDLETVKKLVRQAQGKRTPPPEPEVPEPRTRDIGTQNSDLTFEYICTCFSEEEVDKFLKEYITNSKMFDPSAAETQWKVVSGSVTPSYFNQSTTSFATDIL